MPLRRKKKITKDKFIDLAQAALEEAELEEDRKSVLGDVVEALISTTGAPMMAEVIAQQLSSQDVIERTAEEHFDLETHRRQRSPSVASTTSTTSSLAPLEIPDDLTDIIDPTDYKEHDLTSPSAPCPLTPGATSSGQNTMSFLLADYLWRVFKILLLASLVALVYHFYMHHPQYFRFLLHPTTPLHGPPTW